LQHFLAGDPSIYPEQTISGFYGGLTRAAVERFQIRYGVVTGGSPDTTGFGAVGPSTRARIASVCTQIGSGPTIPTVPVPQTTCFAGGIAIASGIAQRFYSTTAAPQGATCDQYAQVRSCTNGILSGLPVFQYPSCREFAQQTCVVGAITIDNGASRTFFSRPRVDAGESCNNFAAVRSCNNGSVAGSSNYTYPTCSIDTPDSCSVDGMTVSHGASRTFYTAEAAVNGASCSSISQVRSCNDGSLSGDSQYAESSCTPGGCSLDGVVVANGSTRTFYFAQNIPASEQCIAYAQQRTCTNGVLNGTSAYKYASCSQAASGACVLDSSVIPSGSSGTFFSTSTAPSGSSCTSYSATRTCTNGVFSGSSSYNRSVCTDTQSCTLNGITLVHGSSTIFYNALTVPFGTTCSSKALTRTCINGTYSGSSSYQYPSCTVNPPTSSLNTQLASALVALESALETLLAWFKR
jgi:hypothetical protein